jgi:hypothetical protein
VSLIDDLEAAIAKYPCPPSRLINIYGCVMTVAAKCAIRLGFNKAQWLAAVGDAYDRVSAGAGSEPS